MKLTFHLGSVKTRTALSAKLLVDVRSIDLVVLTENECSTNDCPLLTIENNRNKCPLCLQGWFPLEDRQRGRRGYGLFGLQFMKQYQSKSTLACCCYLPLCENIGYSHEGNFGLPSDPDQCRTTLRVLVVPSAKRNTMVTNHRDFRIAP